MVLDDGQEREDGENRGEPQGFVVHKPRGDAQRRGCEDGGERNVTRHHDHNDPNQQRDERAKRGDSQQDAKARRDTLATFETKEAGPVVADDGAHAGKKKKRARIGTETFRYFNTAFVCPIYDLLLIRRGK